MRYRGKPEDVEGPGLVNTWVRTKDGAVAIGEPQIAAWWFPSNDHPRDKATFDITVTAPNGHAGDQQRFAGVLRPPRP